MIPPSILRKCRSFLATEPHSHRKRQAEGVGGMDTAADIAKTHGGTTLEMLIDKHKIKMPTWGDKNPAVVENGVKCPAPMFKAHADS